MRVAFAQRGTAVPVQRDDQRGSRDQLADKGGDGVLVGDAGNLDMELTGQEQCAARFVGGQSGMFRLDMAGQPGQVVRRDPLGGRPGGARL